MIIISDHQFKKGAGNFTPHSTIGFYDSKEKVEEAMREYTKLFEEKPIEFMCQGLYVIQRKGKNNS